MENIKTTVVVLVALLAGFVGGAIGSVFNTPVHAQSDGYASVRFFVNGNEVVPVDNKIEFQTFSGGMDEVGLSVFGYDGHIAFRIIQPSPKPIITDGVEK